MEQTKGRYRLDWFSAQKKNLPYKQVLLSKDQKVYIFGRCPAPGSQSLGHKPSQLRGKERHPAGPSYACRA
ncbi:hypothetical protein [Domibacillus tundrae]|uniref:hypothetical protein n=1 Tax=Domibacillus tundrae TaxID=1587527 RepID=UPI000617F8DF|nr:hypothetical protein [Domibacillus tundrae]